MKVDREVEWIIKYILKPGSIFIIAYFFWLVYNAVWSIVKVPHSTPIDIGVAIMCVIMPLYCLLDTGDL